MRLYIKHMVCPRCIMSVEEIFKKLEIPFHSIRLGEVETESDLTKKEMIDLKKALESYGFELLQDPTARLIEKVRNLLIQKVQAGVEEHFSIQRFLTDQILKDYSSVSKLFPAVEGMTIEQFFILQKIEKVKELLIYNEMSLSEIGYFLGYSSTQHLSSQFKKVTGMTPTAFKRLGNGSRRPVNEI